MVLMDKRENVYWLELVSKFYSIPFIPKTDSTPEQFEKSLPKTPPLPEQEKLPNPVPFNSASDENEDELIPCPYDSRISYEKIWGTNVLVMDYDIFKLHHPFSMLVAGPRGAGKVSL